MQEHTSSGRRILAARWATLAAVGLGAGSAFACGGSRTVVLANAPSVPRTQAERTGYRETSTHAHVMAFVDSLTRLGRPIFTGSIGRTTEGREIPFLVVSRPLFGTPEAARQSGRPIVYVQGNIHAGEVEGKEALQALVRDLLMDPRPNILDSIVLIAVPIYNADGNERFAPQARNRGSQNGPEMVGQRPNAQGLDLNRDYMKAVAPETRASLAMFNRWDPHVFVDLHTTNGSYHGYNLTYSPSLNPAAELAGATFGGAWARDSLLPALQQRVQARHQVKTFPYGNFPGRGGGTPTRWQTYEHVPRFGTNYYALRGRISVLSEAYSHDPFETRVRATYAFVRELLSLVNERRGAILALTRRADAALRAGPAGVPPIPLRAQLTTTPYTAEVVYEEIERQQGDTTRHQAGMPPGARRTGRFRAVQMQVFDRFTPTLTRPLPWGWAIAAGDTSALQLVRQHGVVVERLGTPWSGDAGPQFTVDSAVIAAQPFQERRLVRLVGRWESGRTANLAAGTWIVRSAQPLGVLAAYLLEPESDDGVVAWDVGGRSANGPGPAPIVRLAQPLPGPLDRSP
ncbi:MAG TPA: M14 family metallopeptidase [Gemmatimonadaceae bacterium]|nr:M14 family metallopeptidase [Gemmatimonadaceae bacterium]